MFHMNKVELMFIYWPRACVKLVIVVPLSYPVGTRWLYCSKM